MLIAQAAADIFGKIEPPKGVNEFNTAAGGEIGILLFFSSVIKLFTIVAGIWTLFNFILAGFTYVTSQGDSGAHQKVRSRITMSILGMILIAASFTIMGILGFVLFGDAAYFVNPTLFTPADLTGGGP